MAVPMFHAAIEADWSARTETEYRPAGYADEGFVHCSNAAQLPRVLDARFRGRTDLLVLTIDQGAVTHRLVWEDLYGAGEDFPHIYGPVELRAVRSVDPLPCRDDGGFDWSPPTGQPDSPQPDSPQPDSPQPDSPQPDSPTARSPTARSPTARSPIANRPVGNRRSDRRGQVGGSGN